jgi:hypothetical protein
MFLMFFLEEKNITGIYCEANMNLFRVIFLVFILLFSKYSLAKICVNMSPNLAYGNVSASSILLAPQWKQEVFKGLKFKDYQLFVMDNNVLINSNIEKMIANSCDIILGLTNSRDCLLAGELLQKNKVVGVSANCMHNAVAKFNHYIYTGSQSLNDYFAVIADYLHKTPNLGSIYAVYRPADIYSSESLKSLKRKYLGEVTEITVTKDGEFDITKLLAAKESAKTLIICTYPLLAAKVISNLDKYKVLTQNTVIIGMPTWFADSGLLKLSRPVLQSIKKVLVPGDANIDWEKVKKTNSIKLFIRKLGELPSICVVYEYDMTAFVVYCYKQSLVNDVYKFNLFQKCMTHTKYHGLSGTFSFNSSSPFAVRSIHMVNFLKELKDDN